MNVCNETTNVFFTAFSKLFQRPTGKFPATPKPPKRAKHGHEKTPIAICLACFGKGKKKFWLSRCNPSSVNGHLSSTHKGENISRDQVVAGDTPAAKEAMQVYQRMQSG